MKAGGLGTVARSVAVRVESELGEREEGTGLLGRGLPFPGQKPMLPAVPFWQARARNPVHAPGWALMSLVTALTLQEHGPGQGFPDGVHTGEAALGGAITAFVTARGRRSLPSLLSVLPITSWKNDNKFSESSWIRKEKHLQRTSGSPGGSLNVDDKLDDRIESALIFLTYCGSHHWVCERMSFF